MISKLHQKAKTPLGLLFFTVFLDLLGYGILIPVIPQLLANPHSPFYLLPSNFSLDTGYIMLGFLIAVFPFGQFLATPILGQLSDRYGRKPILALSIFGTGLSYILFAIGIITKNIPLLFISRFFDGLTGGNISVAQAAIADLTKPENRTKTFGMLGAAFGLGFIVGPFIGGKLSDPHFVSWFNAATPFWFAAILAVLNTSLILYRMKETNEFMNKKKILWTKAVKNVVAGFTMPKLSSLFIVNFFYYGGFTFFTTFLSVYLIQKFNFTQGNIGDFFAYVGICVAITQAVVTQFFAKRYSQSQILTYTLFFTGIFLVLYLAPAHAWQLLFVVPFFSMANGLTMANMNALISKRAPEEIRGEIFGISSSVQALAQTIPAVLSGFIASVLKPSTPILVSALCILVGSLFFTLVDQKKNV